MVNADAELRSRAISDASPKADVSHTVTRAAAMYRFKITVLVGAIVVAGLAYVIASKSVKSYAAQATIRVTFLDSAGALQDSAIGQNDAAGQYAQLASTTPVIALAAKRLGISTSGLANRVSAAPIGSYNVVGVTATAATPTLAGSLATADANSLAIYVQQTYKNQEASIRKSTASLQSNLQGQISLAESDISRDEATIAATSPSSTASLEAETDAVSQRSLLATLTGEMNGSISTAVRSLAEATPNLTVLNAPQKGSLSGISPKIVALIALIVGLLLFGEAAYFASNIKVARAQKVIRVHQRKRSHLAPDEDSGPGRVSNGSPRSAELSPSSDAS